MCFGEYGEQRQGSTLTATHRRKPIHMDEVKERRFHQMGHGNRRGEQSTIPQSRDLDSYGDATAQGAGLNDDGVRMARVSSVAHGQRSLEAPAPSSWAPTPPLLDTIDASREHHVLVGVSVASDKRMGRGLDETEGRWTVAERWELSTLEPPCSVG
jgi:hypothetical protein